MFNAVATLFFRRNLAALTHPATIFTEFALGIILLVGDGWVFARVGDAGE